MEKFAGRDKDHDKKPDGRKHDQGNKRNGGILR
jgi:hypothetical protein